MLPRIKTFTTRQYVEVSFIEVDKKCYFKFGAVTGVLPVTSNYAITLEQRLEEVVATFIEKNSVG